MSARRSSRLPPPPAASAPTDDVQPPSPITVLRRQWKWAAIGSFFHTFAPLIAVDEVTINEIEDDLVFSSLHVIPRIMHRLLYTLTGDRRISVENWQTTIRKQYLRRDPDHNLLGWEAEQGIKRGFKSMTHSRQMSTDVTNDVAASPREDGETQAQTNGEATLPTGIEDTEELVNKEPHSDDGEEENIEPPKDWTELTMLEKVDVLHTIIEWHFQNPVKLRHNMRSDDDRATWRPEPIGYDAQKNSYWLIGPDRLWMQREVPKPPRTNLKRKAPPKNKNAPKKKAMRAEAQTSVKEEPALARGSSKKRGTGRGANGRKLPARTAVAKGGRREVVKEEEFELEPMGRSRAAKTKANIKLDIQAKQLAETRAELLNIGKKNGKVDTRPPPPRGTRVSRRLRQIDDEWQQIPDEWLTENAQDEAKKSTEPPEEGEEDVTVQNFDAFDGASELTELSDSETEDFEPEEPERSPSPVVKREELEQAMAPLPLPPNFVEWETICVSMEEWEGILKRFEGATHYLEKALHKTLLQVVPPILEIMREVQRQRQREEAVVNRKRSSRIAMKESEREEQRLAAEKRAAEEEQLARARRAEARAKKEQEDRDKREKAREQRQKERWERENKSATPQKGDVSHLDIKNGELQLAPVNGYQKTSRNGAHRSEPDRDSRASSSSSTWELDCEICGAKGINRDDGVPVVSCGRCAKWQHIACHDAADSRAGRQKRDWSVEDFTCKGCLNKLGLYARNDIGSRYPPSSYFNGHNHNSRTPLSAAQILSDMQSMASSRGSSRGAYEQSDYMQNHNSAYNLGTRSDTNSPAPPHNRGLNFAHYEPHQRGYSSHYTASGPTPPTRPEDVQYAHNSGYPMNHQTQQYGWRPYNVNRNGGSYSLPPITLPSPNTLQPPYPNYHPTPSASPSQMPYASHLHGRDATYPTPSVPSPYHHQPVADGSNHYPRRDGSEATHLSPLGSGQHLGNGPHLPTSPLARGPVYPVAAQPSSASYHYQR